MDKFMIEIPELCLVALIGASSSGKSTFAHKYFKPTEVLSSDFFRGMISDDENDQTVTREAFELLWSAADKRLANRKLTVIDAMNTRKSARSRVLQAAREHNVPAAAIVLDLPEALLQERNKTRTDRELPERVIRQLCVEVDNSIINLKREGFRFVYIISSPEQLENCEIVRTEFLNRDQDEHTELDFDEIFDEHKILLSKLTSFLRYKDE
ncbi:MAG: AAA family ATPase [Ruminococcus sp.]|nr:AAA family ATPase [Ruminococcus sp.]